MSARQKPPFRADHVGSLLRPQRLVEARAMREKGEITAEALTKIEDECILEIIRRQEDIGLKGVTDGEFRRRYWHIDFLSSFSGVSVVEASINARFHTKEGDLEWRPPGLRVSGRLARPRSIMASAFEFVKQHTRQTAKLTIPSPSTMHFRGGRRAIDDKAYPEMQLFYDELGRIYSEEVADLARIGCTYLQVDEVNLAYLCDPKLQEQVRGIGEDPKELPHTYARLINASIATRPKEMTICMHLCRGNFQSGWVAEGGYDPVAEILFNEINVDGYFLEYDTERAGSFAPLRFVPKGKMVVLGLVTSKSGELETADDLKRRIDEAAKHCPLDQLALSPQCGFSSTLEGNKLTEADQWRKLELCVKVATEVWGGV
jgi:5-methyltetrahydropteroyltriglutamate--homocysteine methyltransferase